jgi:festuclavine dehydrogenase
MTVLLTGGTGKSATPLANLLLNANVPLILATRSGKVPAPFRGARFDWLDASTYQIPFDTDSNIDRIYLIPPPVLDMFPPMKAFIDFAIQKGVKRFVLMSAALLEEGGPAMGKVHEYLHSRQVEYCVLRPSWFFGTSLLPFLWRLPVDMTVRQLTPPLCRLYSKERRDRECRGIGVDWLDLN